MWRESPIVFGPPFDFLIDWFFDEYGGGDKFDAYPYRNRGRKRNPPKRPAPPKSAKPAPAAAR